MAKIRVTLTKSTIAKSSKIKAIVRSMGLRRLGQVKTYEDNNCIRGMVNKVSNLVHYELVD